MMYAAFEGINTRITWGIRNGRLMFLTDDFVASSIEVDFKEDVGVINPIQVISGLKQVGVPGSEIWDISVVLETPLNNTVSFNLNPKYNKFSENSLVVEKMSTVPLYITQRKFLQENTKYTLSAYIHSDDRITSNHLQCKITNEEKNWTKIEKLDDNWWRVIYTFINEYAGDYNIGFVIKEVDRIYIDSVQLEAKTFASPFVESTNNTIGRIKIGKSLLNKERGTIFFKFKPYFEYENNETKTIISLPAYDAGIVNQSLGLKVIYYFDSDKNRGIFEYSINNDSSSIWRFETTDDFFNQWHSIGFVYDYINNRFVYWFDYFNYIIDSPFANNIWADMYIGYDTSTEKAADIVVKDVIIHDYTTTDSEVLNWNTTYEFYNESFISSNIEEMKNEILGIKQDTYEYVDITNDIVNTVNSLQSRVAEYEENEINNDNAISKLKNFTGYAWPFNQDSSSLPSGVGNHENRITTLEATALNLDIKTTSIQNNLINTNNAVNTLDGNIDTLSDGLNNEINARVIADQQIKDLYASTDINKGAALIGVYDVGARYSATTVEDILQEIAGAGRTTESLKSLKDDITAIGSSTSTSLEDLDYMQDGNSGLWTRSLAQSSGYNIYNIKTNLTALDIEVESIKDNQTSVAESYQDILTGFVDADDTALSSNGDYSLIINGGEYYFTTSSIITWEDLIINYLPNAIHTTSGLPLSLSYRIEAISYIDGVNTLYNIRIFDKTDYTLGHAINIQSGISYLDLISSLGATLSSATAIGSSFIASTMNNVTLSSRITQEVNDRQATVNALRTDLLSQDLNRGASLIGVEGNGLFIETTVEDVLQELAGPGRNASMTVAGNYNAIQGMISDISTLQTNTSSNSSSISNINNTLGLMKDGIDGSTWNALATKPNLMNHESRITTNTQNISSANVAIAVNSNDIFNLNQSVGALSTGLSTEINNRVNGDLSIRQDLASTTVGKGASLISIQDVAGKYTATTVEGALAEVDDKIAALAGALSWQSPVNTYADLPTSGNTVGNARTVLDDGDGRQAQYVWSGTAWVKIADIDWGQASDISYNNTTSTIPATTVQAAIDYVYLNQKDKTSSQGEILNTAWQVGSGQYNGYYYADVNHGLGTTDVVCLITENGIVIGVEEIERLDANNVRIYVADNSLNLDITVFGVIDKYSKVVSQWTPDGQGGYYADIVHNFNTNKLMVSTFDIDTTLGLGWLTGAESIEFIDLNTIRVKTADNATTMNVFIVKKANNSITKDIQKWTWDPTKNAYISLIQVDASYDAVFTFFDPSTGKTVGIDMVQLENGVLTLARSQNDIIRMIIVK